MPYQGYANGFYLVKQQSQKKVIIDHYGIIDIGNTLLHPDVDGINPVIIQQIPPKITISWLHQTGSWEILGVITDHSMATARIRKAAENPEYDLFGHNCEHFARYVATGKSESTQLQAATVIGLVALTLYALR